ncbi:uncharacterized protein LOC141690868 [Apium graveolens]|uniref:uncharacterized protein LOC141690867 n=1 Tax=Apium graveolens TaxID=4045 RepID=UPI003D793C2E
MDKAFTLIQVSDDSKTDYASYFLKGESNFWWECTRALEGEGHVSWARFTKLFLEKYFPDSPGYVNTEIQKARRFQQGLNPEVRSGVVALQLKMYTSVVQATLVIESDRKLASKERSDKKRKFDNSAKKADQEDSIQKFSRKFGRNRKKRFMRQGFTQTSSGVTSVASAPAQSTRPIVECKSCRRKHSGQCRKDVQCFKYDKKGHYASECNSGNLGVTCFKCGKVGHISRNCKMATQGSVGGSESQGPETSTARARTFKMTKRSNAQDSDVVADEPLTIEVANQDKVPVSQFFPRCQLEICGRFFTVDLIHFELGEFDIILGMDWLSQHMVNIDCKKKKILLYTENNIRVTYQGQK